MKEPNGSFVVYGNVLKVLALIDKNDTFI